MNSAKLRDTRLIHNTHKPVAFLYTNAELQDLLELTPKKHVLFVTGDWNAKIESQETPEVIGIFGLRVQNVAGKRLIEFCQENAVFVNS